MKGTELRSIRKEKGLTQLAFAMRLNVERALLSRYETGHQCIPRDIAEKAIVLSRDRERLKDGVMDRLTGILDLITRFEKG